MEARILSLLAETPVHAGTGADLGAVDLPIQRERHTELPVIHSSGLKGALKDLSRRKNEPEITNRLFGPDPIGGPDQALSQGVLVFTDARLLLFPVRTAGPAFAWVTSPYCLSRFERDLADVAPAMDALRAKVREAARLRPADDAAMVANAEAFGLALGRNAIVLEEYELGAAPRAELEELGKALKVLIGGGAALDFWRQHAARALVLVHDDMLRDFCKHATEVVTRVRIEPETKTVAEHALWTEEYLPADSLLYAMVGLTPRAGDAAEQAWEHLGKIMGAPVQLGGNETIGRGIMRARLVRE